MPKLNPRDRSSFEELEAAIAPIRREWSDQQNVLEIVPCIKVKGRVPQMDTLAIGFRVSHKYPPEELRTLGLRPIPGEIKGIPTDVILAHGPALGGVDEKATRSQMFDTLLGGIAVGNGRIDAYGTLGMVLLAESDGRMVGLTNEHVLVFDIDGKVGDPVEQPRFYLNSEVSLEAADCCPDGVLRYRGVDNPIVDAAAAVFAAAALAAVLSDRIDPHRRGQTATPTGHAERTLRESVKVSIGYRETPMPGRPYKLGVKWRYARHTDQRVLQHEVGETVQNEHVTDLQRLFTDRDKYLRGDTVRFLAFLGPDRYSERCNLFVTAAGLSPSHREAIKLVLRPCTAGHQRYWAKRADIQEAAAGRKQLCAYCGEYRLPPDAELGQWPTFLFAQTLNDVPAGTEPAIAATTIGGMPVTNNFVETGRTTHILYGPACGVALRPDGSFEVIADAEPPLEPIL